MALLLNFRNAIVIINASKICTLWNVSTLQKYDNTCLFIFHYFIVNFLITSRTIRAYQWRFCNRSQRSSVCTRLLCNIIYKYTYRKSLPLRGVQLFAIFWYSCVYANHFCVLFLNKLYCLIRHEQTKVTPLKMQCSTENVFETVKCKISIIMILVPLY